MKNGKKYLLIAIPVVLALVIFCLFFTVGTARKIPLADGLRFGMSPKQAAKVLGEPYQVELDASLTGKNTYTYNTVVLDQEAIVTCYFWNDKQLTEVVFQWATDPKELSAQAYAYLYDHFSHRRDFFTMEDCDLDTKANHISVGIDNGLTGTFYNLYTTDTSLQITCLELS